MSIGRRPTKGKKKAKPRRVRPVQNKITRKQFLANRQAQLQAAIERGKRDSER